MRLARRPFISYTSSHFLWYFHVGTFWQFFFFLCYHNHVFQFGLRMKTHAIENPPFYADILWYGKAKLGTSCHANFLLGYEQKTTPNREREKQCTFVFNSYEGVYTGSSRLHTFSSSRARLKFILLVPLNFYHTSGSSRVFIPPYHLDFIHTSGLSRFFPYLWCMTV